MTLRIHKNADGPVERLETLVKLAEQLAVYYDDLNVKTGNPYRKGQADAYRDIAKSGGGLLKELMDKTPKA